MPLDGLSRGELAGAVEDLAAFARALPIAGAPGGSYGHTRRDYLEIATSTAFPAPHEDKIRYTPDTSNC